MLHRKLLKGIIKYCENKNYVFTVKNCMIFISDFDTALDCSFCRGQFESAMRYLIDTGYIERIDGGFRLTYKALHRRFILLKNVGLFLIKSIIVPVFVAALTALVTMCIKGLL